jgi:hypothetical protein
MPGPTCYVCGHEIARNALCVPGPGPNDYLYRHRSACEPGSERFMQNQALAQAYLSLFRKDGAVMKKDEVKVGGVYAAKVSDKVVPVRLDSESQYGGWIGTNLKTGKQVRIKSAQRLRAEVKPTSPPATQEAPTANGVAKGENKAAHKSKDGKGKKAATPRDTGAPAKTPAKDGGDGKLSGLDAAAKVLAEATEPLGCKQIVEQALAKGYWSSDGKTPWATVYSAILREIQQKGAESRFRKTARGKFELAR